MLSVLSVLGLSKDHAGSVYMLAFSDTIAVIEVAQKERPKMVLAFPIGAEQPADSDMCSQPSGRLSDLRVLNSLIGAE